MKSEEKILTIANSFLGRNDVFTSLINGNDIEITPNDYEPKFSLSIDYNKHRNCIFLCLVVANEGKYLAAKLSERSNPVILRVYFLVFRAILDILLHKYAYIRNNWFSRNKCGLKMSA